MGIKVTEGRPGGKPRGQRQRWLQMGQRWRAERKFSSGCVCDRLGTGARGEGPGQQIGSNWEDVLSLTGQDSFRKDQIRRRERGLGVLFGGTWERLAGGKSGLG